MTPAERKHWEEAPMYMCHCGVGSFMNLKVAPPGGDRAAVVCAGCGCPLDTFTPDEGEQSPERKTIQ